MYPDAHTQVSIPSLARQPLTILFMHLLFPEMWAGRDSFTGAGMGAALAGHTSHSPAGAACQSQGGPQKGAAAAGPC